MIGVIVVPGPDAEMHGLDAERSAAMLPLGDRPLLQHVVESLVAQKITTIEMLVGHAPQQVESWFGDGSRWGCSIRYHLTLESDRPYKPLRILDRTKVEPWLLVYGTRFPCTVFPQTPGPHPIVYLAPDHPAPPASAGKISTNAVLFPPDTDTDAIGTLSVDEFATYLEGRLASATAFTAECQDWIDARTPAALLRTQSKLLSDTLPGLMLSGNETAPGLRVSRNVQIHDTAQLIAPVYIGSNCRINRGARLGPNVVLSGDCVIDAHTTLEHCMVTSGNYIGEGLELENAIVDHELLVSVRNQTAIRVAESFLLGKLQQPLQFEWLKKTLRSMVALLLILVCSPVLLLALLYFSLVRRISWSSVSMVQIPQSPAPAKVRHYGLPCLGRDAWSLPRPAGWEAFLRQFLPGIVAVALGRLQFVGLAPRTQAELDSMPPLWRAMYLKSRAGLITEASIADVDLHDQTQLNLVEAYYNARKSLVYSSQVACRYFLRLFVPAAPSSSRSDPSLQDS